jgi:small-conductance mechanosensitive channel
MMPQELKSLLDYQLVVIAGAIVTPGSIAVGVGIFVLATVVAHIASRGTRKVLARRGLATGEQFAASKIVRYSLLAVGAVVALSSMGLKLDALVATSAVLAVGIGFGLQNVAQNFISGVILLIEQPVRKGDFVKVGNALGVIDDIGLRATSVITRDEVTIIVPNSGLITEAVINHSRPTTRLRVRVTVSAAYGSDTRRVSEVLRKVADDEPNVLHDPPPEVRLEAFGESSLDFAILVWIADPREDLRISSALRFAIDDAFRAAKIEIPCPQRELRIRSTSNSSGADVIRSEMSAERFGGVLSAEPTSARPR